MLVLALQDFQGLLSDDVEVRDRAFEELVRMGPKALPAIRAAKAEGDLKLLLEKAARRIEHDVGVARRIPEPLRVSLEARDRPLKELLAGLGQAIDASEAPEVRVTVSLDKVPFWEALHRICGPRADWQFEDGMRVVEAKPGPRVVRGDVVLRVDSVGLFDELLAVGLTVAAPAGRLPDFVRVSGEGEDEQGRSFEASYGPNCASGPAFQPLLLVRGVAGAKRLAVLKGEATLEYVLTRRTTAALRLAELEKGPVEREGLRLSLVLSAGLTPCKVRAPSPEELLPRLVRTEFELSDGKGTSFVVAPNWEHDDIQSIVTWTLLGEWPKDFQPVSFKLREPDDVERVAFPFEFKDLPVVGR